MSHFTRNSISVTIHACDRPYASSRFALLFLFVLLACQRTPQEDMQPQVNTAVEVAAPDDTAAHKQAAWQAAAAEARQLAAQRQTERRERASDPLPTSPTERRPSAGHQDAYLASKPGGEPEDLGAVDGTVGTTEEGTTEEGRTEEGEALTPNSARPSGAAASPKSPSMPERNAAEPATAQGVPAAEPAVTSPQPAAKKAANKAAEQRANERMKSLEERRNRSIEYSKMADD